VSPVELELPTVSPTPAVTRPPVTSISRERYEHLAGRVRLLSWLSLGWMTIEGGVAITAGILASSIALVGFGLDSVVEGVASVIIVWRFSGHRVFSHAAEQRAQKLVAVRFFLLAPYVAFESVSALIGGKHPDVSWVGTDGRCRSRRGRDGSTPFSRIGNPRVAGVSAHYADPVKGRFGAKGNQDTRSPISGPWRSRGRKTSRPSP
jgi:hypothetical protein